MPDWFNWLLDEQNREAVLAIFAGLGLAGGAIAFVWRQLRRKPESQTTSQTATHRGTIQSNNDQAITAQDNAQVNVAKTINQTPDYTIEQHEAKLAATETRIRKDLARAHDAERGLVERELAEVQAQMRDLDASFQAKLKETAALTTQTEKLDPDATPPDEVANAEAALADGDTAQADALFAKVLERAKADIATHAEQGAEAAYQRGLIAKTDIRWADAAAYFAEAVALAPNYDRLFKASEFTWRAGDYETAAG
jgi:tetratricopeptide (TPR) repeat protein